jgi:hypothetical protein
MSKEKRYSIKPLKYSQPTHRRWAATVSYFPDLIATGFDNSGGMKLSLQVLIGLPWSQFLIFFWVLWMLIATEISQGLTPSHSVAACIIKRNWVESHYLSAGQVDKAQLGGFG